MIGVLTAEGWGDELGRIVAQLAHVYAEGHQAVVFGDILHAEGVLEVVAISAPDASLIVAVGARDAVLDTAGVVSRLGGVAPTIRLHVKPFLALLAQVVAQAEQAVAHIAGHGLAVGEAARGVDTEDEIVLAAAAEIVAGTDSTVGDIAEEGLLCVEVQGKQEEEEDPSWRRAHKNNMKTWILSILRLQ